MKEKRFIMMVTDGSTDELRVAKYLEEKKIEYETSKYGISRSYIEFRADKHTVKEIMKHLGFAVESYYCKPKELFQ